MRSRFLGVPSTCLVFALCVAGCADPDSASFARSEKASSNNASQSSWTSDDIELRDASTIKVTLDVEAPVTVLVGLARTPAATAECNRSYRHDVEIDLAGADACVPEVSYSEDLHDCDDCDLGGAIVDAVFSPVQSWESEAGTIRVSYDPNEDSAVVTIDAHFAPGGGSLGGNTAQGEFDLQGKIQISDLDVD